jgi:hypothetical protein
MPPAVDRPKAMIQPIARAMSEKMSKARVFIEGVEDISLSAHARNHFDQTKSF